MKKLFIVFTVLILIFLTGCHPRSSLDDNERNKLYDDFRKMVEDDSLWNDNYIIIIGESAFMSQLGAQYTSVGNAFDQNEISDIFNQYKGYFKNGLSYVEKDAVEFVSGWAVSGYKFCTIDIKSEWILNEQKVPVSSFTFCIYNDGRLRLDVKSISDNSDDEIILCFHITSNWAKELASGYEIAWE